MSSVYLLKKYVRNILTEISKNKQVPGNPAWEEYNAFKANRDNDQQDTPEFSLYNKRGREGKQWFNKHADQNWLNGPAENVIVLHSPVAFSVKQYRNYEECRREILDQYRPDIINRNEMSAIGIVNRNADTVDTDTHIKFTLKQSDRTIIATTLPNVMFLHLSPRRITHAASFDSMSTMYHEYPQEKSVSFSEWHKMPLDVFLKKYKKYLSEKDFKVLLNSLYDDSYIDQSFEEYFKGIKNKYKYLRDNIENYNYDQSFKTSGARKWPNVYTKKIKVDNYGDIRNNILDFEDFNDAKHLHDILGEVIVGNWKIESVYVNSKKVYSNETKRKSSLKKEFEMWYNGKLTDQDIITKYNIDLNDDVFNYLQLFFRVKAFMDAGVKINWF